MTGMTHIITRTVRLKIRPAHRVGSIDLSAALPGTTFRRTSAFPTTTRTDQILETTLLGSAVFGKRLSLDVIFTD